MNFGQAIEHMKEGYSVARKGWNGKNMFVYLVTGSDVLAINLRAEASKHVGTKVEPYDTIKVNSHIDMKAADGSIVVGWLASQTDMLAEDWEIATNEVK